MPKILLHVHRQGLTLVGLAVDSGVLTAVNFGRVRCEVDTTQGEIGTFKKRLKNIKNISLYPPRK